MKIGEISHRADLVEARADVAECGGRGRDSGDDVGAEQNDDGGTHPERQHVEQEEHDHALQNGRGDDASVELHWKNGPGMQRAPQFLQRELRKQHVPHHLWSAAGRAGATADEHQAKQHQLGLVIPELKIDAGKSGGGNDRQYLEQRGSNRVARAHGSPRGHGDEPGRDQHDRHIRAQLFIVGEQLEIVGEQRAVLQREVGAGEEHEHDDHPFGGGVLVARDR